MPAPLKRIVLASAAVAVLAAAAFYVLSHPSARLTADRLPAPATRAVPALAGSTAILGQAIARMNVPPSVYTVRPGDSLTSIAARHYGKPGAWPAIYWANDREIRWADRIEAGQVLVIPAEPRRIPAAPPQLEPAAPKPRPVPVLVAYTPAQAPVHAQAAVSTAGESSFEACVISRESGGDATAVNPTSGAGGLFGFLPSTWASLGYSGLPEDAPVSVQDAAFAKLYAEAGTSPWAASDGC